MSNKIMLFGSAKAYAMPEQLRTALTDYARNGWQFILSDGKGADEIFNKEISKLGLLDACTVYCLDRVRINQYKLKTRMFNSVYNDEDKSVDIYSDTGERILHIDNVGDYDSIGEMREYNTFIDKQMMEECAMAFCIWDGESKRERQTIQSLNARDKNCYAMIIET